MFSLRAYTILCLKRGLPPRNSFQYPSSASFLVSPAFQADWYIWNLEKFALWDFIVLLLRFRWWMYWNIQRVDFLGYFKCNWWPNSYKKTINCPMLNCASYLSAGQIDIGFYPFLQCNRGSHWLKSWKYWPVLGHAYIIWPHDLYWQNWSYL